MSMHPPARFIAALTAIVALSLGYQPAWAAFGTTDDSEPGFWDNHAVVLAQVISIRAKDLKVKIIRVLTAPFAVADEMDVELATGGNSALHAPRGDTFVVLLVRKEPRSPLGWTLPADHIAFMPSNSAIVDLDGENDPRIEELQKRVREMVALRQLAKIAEAKKSGDKRMEKEIQDYNYFWQSHCLVLAQVQSPNKLLRIEVKSALFAPQFSPNGKILGPVMYKENAVNGEWLLLLLDSQGGVSGGRIPLPFMPDNTGLVQLKDDKDPRIDQIQKAAQGWFQQILDNAGAKPPAPVSSTVPASAPAPATRPSTTAPSNPP